MGRSFFSADACRETIFLHRASEESPMSRRVLVISPQHPFLGQRSGHVQRLRAKPAGLRPGRLVGSQRCLPTTPRPHGSARTGTTRYSPRRRAGYPRALFVAALDRPARRQQHGVALAAFSVPARLPTPVRSPPRRGVFFPSHVHCPALRADLATFFGVPYGSIDFQDPCSRRFLCAIRRTGVPRAVGNTGW